MFETTLKNEVKTLNIVTFFNVFEANFNVFVSKLNENEPILNVFDSFLLNFALFFSNVEPKLRKKRPKTRKKTPKLGSFGVMFTVFAARRYEKVPIFTERFRFPVAF